MGLEDIFTGAVTRGVNISTFILLNVFLFCAVAALSVLLLVSLRSAPPLVPHAAFLLCLALVLWALLVWFILNVGFVDPEAQRQELAGGSGAAAGTSEGEGDQPSKGKQQQQQQSPQQQGQRTPQRSAASRRRRA